MCKKRENQLQYRNGFFFGGDESTILGYLYNHGSLSLLRCESAPRFVNQQKRCTRLATVYGKVCQLPTQGGWFSVSTSVSSTSKTGSHYIVYSQRLTREKDNIVTETLFQSFSLKEPTIKVIPSKQVAFKRKIRSFFKLNNPIYAENCRNQ